MSPVHVRTAPIDCDVHVAPSSIGTLLSYVDPYWVEYHESTRLSLDPALNGMYPRGANADAGDGPGPMAVPTDLAALEAGPLVGSAARVVLNCVTSFNSARNVYYEAALCRALNDWLCKEWLERDDRTRASLCLPILDPDAAVEEIERLGSHPGFVQALLPVRAEIPLGNKRYHKIYAAAEKRGLVIGVHAWGRPWNAPTGTGFADTYLEDYAANSQVIVQAQVTSLVAEGVFDRCPGLRVAVLECGFSWLPFYLWRFDKDWKGLWREVPWMTARPSEYVLKHFRFATTPAHLPADPAVLAGFARLLPWQDMLLYTSDFPHRHGSSSVQALVQHLDDGAGDAIHCGNAAALYSLET